jgi:hypothetical protein
MASDVVMAEGLGSGGCIGLLYEESYMNFIV